MNVSYKPQKISPKFQGTVRQLLHTKIRDSYVHPQFITDVMKPLHIDGIIDQEVLNLSGGELQRVALTICLGQVCYHSFVIHLILFLPLPAPSPLLSLPLSFHFFLTSSPPLPILSPLSLLMCILLMSPLLISIQNNVLLQPK